MTVNPPMPDPIKTPARSANSGSMVESGLLHRKIRRGHGVMDEVIHLLDILLVEPLQRIEVFDFGGDAGGIMRRVEPGDRDDAASAFTESFPGFFCSSPSAVTRPTPVTTTLLFSKLQPR